MIRALKVKKARMVSGRCPLCRTVITAGQQIGQYENVAGWLHTACAGRRCEHCHERLPLTRIAQGFTAHPMCQGEAE